MNTQIEILTLIQISAIKSSGQSEIYNAFSSALGLKQVKKFRDKATGVSRIMQIQDQYLEEVAKIKPTKSKSKSSRFNMDSVVKININHGKLGSIENSIHSAISSGSNKVSEIVDFVLSNHMRPRSTLGVTEQYVIHNIKWFVKVGSLKLEE